VTEQAWTIVPEDVRIEIGADPPPRLDKALARDAPQEAALSRSRLAKLIAAGAVRRGAAVLDDPRARVASGDVITVAIADAVDSDMAPEAIPLDIRHEDDDLIVVDKPAGMVTHPAPGAGAGTLVNALLAHCGEALSGVGGQRRPGIVHRLDKDTSGLLVVAKTDRAHHGLAEQFAAHSVERAYRAVVHGAPDRGDPRLAGLPGVGFEAGGVIRIATQIGRHRTDRQRQAVLGHGGKAAVTRARVLARYGDPVAAALLECRLETGRTHQIRVHMAHVGHPLIGDATYGTRRRAGGGLSAIARAAADAFPRQALHAATLGFHHPITQSWMAFDSPMPQDVVELVETLSDNATEQVPPRA